MPGYACSSRYKRSNFFWDLAIICKIVLTKIKNEYVDCDYLPMKSKNDQLFGACKVPIMKIKLKKNKKFSNYLRSSKALLRALCVCYQLSLNATPNV